MNIIFVKALANPTRIIRSFCIILTMQFILIITIIFSQIYFNSELKTLKDDFRNREIYISSENNLQEIFDKELFFSENFDYIEPYMDSKNGSIDAYGKTIVKVGLKNHIPNLKMGNLFSNSSDEVIEIIIPEFLTSNSESLLNKKLNIIVDQYYYVGLVVGIYEQNDNDKITGIFISPSDIPLIKKIIILNILV